MSATGSEKFGLVEIAPEYAGLAFKTGGQAARRGSQPVYTAALRLSGAVFNRWLAGEQSDRAFYASLCKALPAGAGAQFLLRRRAGELSQHYAAWQQLAMRRMPDDEVAFFFLQDYLDNVIYPAEDNGLSNLWYGLLISGRSEDELTATMASLIAALPCEASPCPAEELVGLLLDYFAPGVLEEQVEPGSQLYAEWLTGSDLEISEERFYNGLSTAYWSLVAPPLSSELGWLRPILECPDLNGCDFDISVHLMPASQEANLREVLDRRLVFLTDQLEQALQRGESRSALDIEEQRQEILKRLAGLSGQDYRYFELGVTLALRTGPENLEEMAGFLEEELRQSGLAAQRTRILSLVQGAMLACAPLNLNQLDRPFILPAAEAGRLAHLACISRPAGTPDLPLAGISAAGEPVYLNPAARPGHSAFFLLGEQGQTSTKEANSLARYLAAMRWLKGGAICGFDRKGNWNRLVEQLGGRYIAFGPYEGEFNFNPLEVTAESLNQPGGLESWINDTGNFVAALLGLDEDLREDLRAVLVEAGVAKVRRSQEISAAGLWIQAESGGYLDLAAQLKQLGYNGRYGWLFARPTRLPLPVRHHDLLFLGLSPWLRQTWSEEAQQYYFARLFARFAAQVTAYQPARPYLLLVDEAQELLLDQPATRALSWLGQQAGRIGASLWLLSPRADQWLNSYSGRGMLEKAHSILFFNQNGVGLTGLARRINLSQRFVKAVREAVPGAAVVRELDEDGEVIAYAFNPLPGEYVARLGYVPAQFAAPVNGDYPEPPKPVEVALFARDEIWNERELENLKGAAETGWTEIVEKPEDSVEKPEDLTDISLAYA